MSSTPVCDIRVGWSTLPYFISGLISVVGLMGISMTLFIRDNSMKRGIKTVDLIVPVYTAPVVFVTCVGVAFGLINMFAADELDLICTVLKWFLYRFVNDGLAVFLLHNGIGRKAYYNALYFGTFWSVSSSVTLFFVGWYAGPEAYVAASFVLLGILLLLYLIYWLAPRRWLHRRPAMVNYSFFNAAIICAYMTLLVMITTGNFVRYTCVWETLYAVCFMVQPFVILYAIRQDSQFWQGLYRKNSIFDCLLQFLGKSQNKMKNGGAGGGGVITSFFYPKGATSTLNEPLMGMWDFGRKTMDMVADTITRLETKVVPIIPFGFIRIDSSHFFSGGTARVYRGRYQREQVAVKFLFCLELTQERVKDFVSEASMLTALQHPNVVECMGVSVMPPAICLVTEWCSYGSLYDFLHSSDFIVRQSVVSQGSFRGSRTSLSARFCKEGAISDISDPWTDISAHLESDSGHSCPRSDLDLGNELLSAANDGKKREDIAFVTNANNVLAFMGEVHQDHNQSLTCSVGGLSGIDEASLGSETSALLSTRSPLNKSAEKNTTSMRSASPASLGLSIVANAEVVDKQDGEESNDGSDSLASPTPTWQNNEDLARTLANACSNTIGSNDGPSSGGGSDVPTAGERSGNNKQSPGNSPDEAGKKKSLISRLGYTVKIARRRAASYVEEVTSERASSTSFRLSMGDSFRFSNLFPSMSVDAGKDCHRISDQDSADLESGHSLLKSNISTDINTAYNARKGKFGRKAVAVSGAQPVRRSNVVLRKLSAIMPTFGLGDSVLGRSRLSSQSSETKTWSDSERRSHGYSYGSELGSDLAPHENSNVSALLATASSQQDLSGLISAQQLGSATSRHSVGQVIPMSLRLRLCHDCCAGVAFLHSKGVMHCDIKSLNFLVDNNLTVKLADLGEARMIPLTDAELLNLTPEHKEKILEKPKLQQDRRPFPQNINWSAPEVLLDSNDPLEGRSSIKASADVWSLTMVMSEVLTGNIPFDTAEDRRLTFRDFVNKLEKGHRPSLPKEMNLDAWLLGLLQSGWVYEAQYRCDSVEMVGTLEKELAKMKDKSYRVMESPV